MFYLVDKPVGPSSNQALSHIKRFFSTKKAGHSGTLDPLASGMLIVATDGSTKLLSLLDTSTKKYRFTFDITKTSESLDLGTPLLCLPTDHTIFKTPPSEKEIQKVLGKFLGEIEQTPPKYSAIWIEGKRSYSEARKGNIVNIPVRKVNIFSLELIEYSFPYITIDAHVSAGAYIRTLAKDIGMELGGTGILTELRRTQINHYTFNEAKIIYHELHPGEHIGIEEISYREIFPDFESIDLTKEELTSLSFGMNIQPKKNYTSEYVLGYFDGNPISLLKPKGMELAPIRLGI